MTTNERNDDDEKYIRHPNRYPLIYLSIYLYIRYIRIWLDEYTVT